jgi:hypothetical protein
VDKRWLSGRVLAVRRGTLQGGGKVKATERGGEIGGLRGGQQRYMVLYAQVLVPYTYPLVAAFHFIYKCMYP